MDKILITLEEFAKKFGISRSTAYTWLAEGKLVVGRHVVRIGRVTRVMWSQGLLEDLLAISAKPEEKAKHPPLVRTGRGGRNRHAFDPTTAREYLGFSNVAFPGRGPCSDVKSETGRNTPGDGENQP